MKNIRIFIFLICVMLIFPFSAVYADGEAEAVPENKIQMIIRDIDDYIKELIDAGDITGASASMVKDGETVFLKGYGYADKESGTQADPNYTAFRIGSVSKTFVALAAMQLVERGKLDMRADITKYIDDFPETKYPITMHDLLTHSAGFEETGRGLAVETESDMTPLEYTVKEHLPEQIYKPGEIIAYSNYGMALAGYVIECIEGKDFSSYVRENIFEPARMINAAFSCEDTGKSIISLAYGKGGEEKKDGIINYYPSGAITATASDMAGYMLGLLSDDGMILGAEYKRMMFEKQFSMEESFPGFGYAWGRYEQNGHLFNGHMGGTDNFSTLVMIYPEDGLGIFVSCNTSASRALGQICGIVSKKLYGENAEMPQSSSGGINSEIDLKGSWCSTVRTEKGPEKIYNIFSTLKFGYDESIGYEFMGEPFISVGENIFFHPNFGHMKYVQEGTRQFLFTEESGALVKIPWYESIAFQIITIAGFSIIALAGFVFSLIRLIKCRKENVKNIFETASYIMGILLFIALAAQLMSILMFFFNIEFAKVESFLVAKRVLSYILMITGVAHLASSIGMYISLKGKLMVKTFFGIIDIGFIVYLIWMLHMNLLV